MKPALVDIAGARQRRNDPEVSISGRRFKLVLSGSSTKPRVDVFEPRKDKLGTEYWKETRSPSQKELLIALRDMAEKAERI